MRIVITGCNGRMGKELIAEIFFSNKHILAGALARKGSNIIGKDINELFNKQNVGLNIEDDIASIKDIDAIIDFTSPESSLKYCEYSAKNSIPIIVGTTGFSEDQIKEITKFASSTKIFLSYNMSIGINLLIKLIEQASNILSNDYDAEVYEMHHRNKVDAPSGTALMIGKAIARGRNIDFDDQNLIFNRKEIVAKREQGKIGFTSLRGGGIIGDHKAIFASNDDVIEFSHHAINRSIFAKGAIKAAEWVIKQSKGLYNMEDLLVDLN
ncbi:MAG: 4-hydroxy-tetrahydrodipicolinate reductase [Alphaproteobacteria bacterium]